MGEIFVDFARHFGYKKEYIHQCMTRRQIKLYYHYLQKSIFNELERQATIQWGYDPKKKELQAVQKELAEKHQQDPLYGFPNDIIYFNGQQISNKVAVSQRFWHKLKPEARWDRDRARACAGKDQVARRCSMNDKLWSIWRLSEARHVRLTLKDIKKMILIDVARAKLYPPGWTDSEVSPPQEHIDTLRQEGKLEGILKEIDDATRAN